MVDLTIQDAIPTASPMIVTGMGLLATQALMAAGQPATPTVVVDPAGGKPGLTQPAAELATTLNPDRRLEMAAKEPRTNINIGAPAINKGPAF